MSVFAYCERCRMQVVDMRDHRVQYHGERPRALVFRGPRHRGLMPCPVCKVSPIPKGHAHGAADLTAWTQVKPDG